MTVRIASAALSILALCGPASAANEPLPAPMLPRDFKCDAKIGKSMEFVFMSPAKAFTVTGKVNVTAPRKSADYVPAVFVTLISRDGKAVGLKAFIAPDEPDQLQIGIEVNASDSKKITSWPWRISPVNFVVAITVDGELKVDAGGLVAATKLEDFDAERVSLACSTGKVEFQRVSMQAW
jgi:hypothetical protein